MVCTVVEGPAKIAGGFVLVPVAELMHAWRACRAAPLRISDFRAWLACREMAARRCLAAEGRAVTYDIPELARLLGVGEKRARASVRRLKTAGLIEWSTSAIACPGPSPEAEGPVDSIGRGRGPVAIPRRLLRFLAGGARPALIATALGVLLRCLSRRRRGWDGRGRLKSSWVADHFGVSARQAKAARAELVGLGWLEAEPSDQWSMNRWGRAYRINLAWEAPRPDRRDLAAHRDRVVIERPGPTSTPPPQGAGMRSSPPDLHPDPLPERKKNQEPATGGPAGVRLEGERRGEDPKTSEASRPERSRPVASTTRPDLVTSPTVRPTGGPATRDRPLPPLRLADVRAEDLRDPARVLALHEQAVARGLASPSEDGRLRFAALAEHAAAVGTTNPAGLFASLLRAGRWGFATQAEEDATRRRLREHLHGGGPPAWPAELAVPPVPLASIPRPSEDARVVQEVRTAAIRAGVFRDPWPAFAAANPGWHRGRWDVALAELGLA